MSIRSSLPSSLAAVAALWGLASPVSTAAAASAPPGDVKQAIADYVQHDQALRGGFLLTDPRDGAALRLSFDHVHVDTDDHGHRQSRLVLHKMDGELVAR